MLQAASEDDGVQDMLMDAVEQKGTFQSDDKALNNMIGKVRTHSPAWRPNRSTRHCHPLETFWCTMHAWCHGRQKCEMQCGVSLVSEKSLLQEHCEMCWERFL